MLRTNIPCTVSTASDGTDGYGQFSYGAPVTTSCAVLKNRTEMAKTSLRFDSSHSKGNANEVVGELTLGFNEQLNLHDRINVFNDNFKVMVPPYPITGRNGCAAYYEVVVGPLNAS